MSVVETEVHLASLSQRTESTVRLIDRGTEEGGCRVSGGGGGASC